MIVRRQRSSDKEGQSIETIMNRLNVQRSVHSLFGLDNTRLSITGRAYLAS